MVAVLDPHAFYGAGAAVHRSQLRGADALTGLSGALGTGTAMAGSDPAGSTWAGHYDNAAREVLRASCGLVTGLDHMGVLFMRTGQNYALAERASRLAVVGAVATSGGDYPGAASYAGDGSATLTLPDPPSAAGGSGGPPTGWQLIAGAVGYVWPNGHQDTLRQVAGVWRRAALDVRGAGVTAVYGHVSGLRCPELDAILAHTAALDSAVLDVAQSFEQMAGACSDYADELDQCHSAVIGELRELVVETAATAAIGAAIGVATAGAGTAASGGIVAARCAAVAARVGGFLARLVLAAGRAAQMAVDAAASLVASTRRIQAILRLRIALITPRVARRTRSMQRVERVAQQSLELRTEDSWANLRLLSDHFGRHGKDFGAKGAHEYAALASRYFQTGLQEGLPVKVSKDGTIRMYDVATNTFGAFRADGRTRSFFKPIEKAAYWAQQKGVPM
ncbi:MAG: hypothetical protein ABJA87_01040 [bacterium]